MPPRIPVYIPSDSQLHISQEACYKLEKENTKLHKEIARLSVRNSALITQIAELTVKHMALCTQKTHLCPNCSEQLNYRRKQVKCQPTTTLELVSPLIQENDAATSYFDIASQEQEPSLSFDDLADAAKEYLANIKA